MDRPARAALGGLAVAALLALGGTANVYWLEHRVAALTAACLDESKRGATTATPEHPWAADPLVCDADDLLRTAEKTSLVGVQAKLAEAQRQRNNYPKWPFSVAIFIAVACAIPWFWYFLLGRLREVRDVIAGK